MNTENLTIICDEVDKIKLVTTGQSVPKVELILDDVEIDSLMIQLAEKLDIETVLDYFSDDAIKGYLYEVDARADHNTSEQFNGSL